MKAGIALDDFTPNGIAQFNLFNENKPREKRPTDEGTGWHQSVRLGSVWFAGQGVDTAWKMKREMLSPAWTTCWNDIPIARIK
jgi:DNA polymerase V